MIKYITTVTSLFFVLGCQTMENKDRLYETASFDNDCPKSDIKVLKEEYGDDWGEYSLDVCGKYLTYKRTNETYELDDSTVGKEQQASEPLLD